MPPVSKIFARETLPVKWLSNKLQIALIESDPQPYTLDSGRIFIRLKFLLIPTSTYLCLY